MKQEKNNIEENLESKIAEELAKIESLFNSEEEYNASISELKLLLLIIGQVNDIFTKTMYGDKKIISGPIEAGISDLKMQILHKYVAVAIETGKLPPIPDMTEVVSWIEEFQKEILSQMFEDNFAKDILWPALESISEGILQFTEEEAEKEEVEKNETHD